MSDLLSVLAEPFRHDFMLRALLTGTLVAATCGVLSCFLVLRGWALLGDAVAHAVLPGVVLAYAAGLPLAVGAFASGLLCSAATGWIRRHSRIKEDTVLGVVFTGLFGLGLVLHLKTPSDLHLDHVLFGNLLGIEPSALRQTVGLSLLVLAAVLAARRTLLLAAFDPAQARALGLPAGALDTGLLVLISLAIVAALQAAGVLLVVALLVTPGATAFLLTKRFERMLAISAALAVACTWLGVIVSFHADASTAACIVLAQTAAFVAALLFAPGTGWLRRQI